MGSTHHPPLIFNSNNRKGLERVIWSDKDSGELVLNIDFYIKMGRAHPTDIMMGKVSFYSRRVFSSQGGAVNHSANSVAKVLLKIACRIRWVKRINSVTL